MFFGKTTYTVTITEFVLESLELGVEIQLLGQN